MSDQDSLFDKAGTSQPASTPSASTNPFPAGGPDASATVKELANLRRQVTNLLVLLLVVSGTLAIFLLQQIRYERADLTVLRATSPTVAEINETVSNYTSNIVPKQQEFIKQLGEYAKTHPDIIPMLVRHGVVTLRPRAVETNATPNPQP